MGQVFGEIKPAATLDKVIELLVDFTEQHAQFADSLEQFLPAFCSAQFLPRHVDRMERLDLKSVADNGFGSAEWQSPGIESRKARDRIHKLIKCYVCHH